MDLYPEFVNAPAKVQAKALTFEVHGPCLERGASPCRKCTHLLRMAYHCYYGHHTAVGDVKRAIRVDLENEFRKG